MDVGLFYGEYNGIARKKGKRESQEQLASILHILTT
jgi:hypothetical protein